jgi:asparagine synthase (glutamine-hydrolysing)
MCGFLGIFAPPANPLSSVDVPADRKASANLAHRGNTGRGENFTATAAVFHYRLAFRDLTDGGLQPMHDPQGRASIIFNGELYGYQPLRDRLSATYDFKTRSDTEVILAAYLAYGEDLLKHLDGEYAFVIQDHRDGKLVAARDAFGVKPLFWAATGENSAAPTLLREYRPSYNFRLGGRLHFASEMKGISVPLRWDPRGLDRLHLSLYEEMGTSFTGVFQIAPGALFVALPEGDGFLCRLERKIPKRRGKPSRARSFEEKASELESILAKVVQNKLDADVPLGAYLSGGIDSRIAAFEMSKAGAKIETFTVGFEGADYDETNDVRQFLAAYPNLKGRALRTSNEALEYAYPHAIYASELVQPYTNGSAKWWLSRFARKYVRGVLTGDGSDELFCGYPSYRYLAWWDYYRRSPSAGRAGLYEERVVGGKTKYWEKGLSSQADGRDLEASVQALGWAHPLFAQVSSLGNFWAGGRLSEILARERPAMGSYVAPDAGASSLTTWQNYFLHTHFPTHVLNWVGDRMEMANTLEGRPIFLSQSTLDFVRDIPDGYLVRGMKDKAVLRKAFSQKLGAFSAAPKKQFNAPFLLDGPLGKEFMTESALREVGLIDPALVARAQSARHDDSDPLAQSFAKVFLQNCLVTQMLDRYLVKGQAPERNLNYEEEFLDKNTETL